MWLLIVCITSSPFVSFLRWLKTVLESAGWWLHPSLLSVTHQATPQPCLQPITCPLIWVTTHTSFRTRTRLIIHLSPFLEICHRSSSPSTTSPRQYIVSKVSPLQLAPVETGYTAVTCVASSLRLLWISKVEGDLIGTKLHWPSQASFVLDSVSYESFDLVGSQLFLAAAPPRTRSRIAPLYSGSESAICPVFPLMSVYLTVASGRAGPQYFHGITIVCQYRGNWNDFCPISNVRRLWSLHILWVFWKICLGRTQQSSCCRWGRPAAGLSLRLAITLTTVSLVARQILTLKGRESQSSRHCLSKFLFGFSLKLWLSDWTLAAREEGGRNETLALGLCKGSSHSDWSICLFKRVFCQFRGILNEFPLCFYHSNALLPMVSFLFSSHCGLSFIIMNKRETWDGYLN